MRRNVVALLVVAVVLLTADLVVRVASPAQAQVHVQAVEPPHLVGVSNDATLAVYRAWSDGRVEEYDNTIISGGVQRWQGWRPVQ